VVVGAYVRLTDAGLGCPDWPGCYGHLRPAAAAADVPGQAKYARPFEYGRGEDGLQRRIRLHLRSLLRVGVNVIGVGE